MTWHGTKRQKVGYHRIQDGKAIIDIRLTNGLPMQDANYKSLQWVGDGYELLEELKEAIRILEDKEAKKKGSKT